MIPLIEENKHELIKLCRLYHVRSLELIGSAATVTPFDDNRSDLDFLVEFLPLERGGYADTYFGLLEALEDLFQRPVDLIMVRAIKNPYFVESINQSRQLLYAA